MSPIVSKFEEAYSHEQSGIIVPQEEKATELQNQAGLFDRNHNNKFDVWNYSSRVKIL